jgi:hypothetical protein
MTKDLEHTLELLKKASAILQRHKNYDSFMKFWPQVKLVRKHLDEVIDGLEAVIDNVQKEDTTPRRS